VRDGVAGAPVAGATVTLRDSLTNELIQDKIRLNSNGVTRLALEPDRLYHISARGPRSSTSTFAFFDPNRETQANMVCLPFAIAGYSTESPVIRRIAFRPYNTNDEAWRDLPPNAHAFWQTRANVDTVGVWAYSRNPITEYEYTDDVRSHKPMRVALDHEAQSTFSVNLDPRIEADLEDMAPWHIEGSGEKYWSSGYAFRLPVVGAIDGEHWMDVVIYDIAGNRTQQRVYITLSDTQPSNVGGTAAYPLDPPITGVKPRFLAAQAHTYGVSQNYAGVSPVPGYGGTSWVYLNVRIDERTGNALLLATFTPLLRIRGFEVWRSTTGRSDDFKMIDRVSYVLPNAGISVIPGTGGGLLGSYGSTGEQRFKYYDTDPELNENTTYYYKMRLYNFNFEAGSVNGCQPGWTQFTDVLATRPLPGFAALMTSPAHNTVVNTLWPTFVHKTSAELVAKGAVTQYRFGIDIRDISATQVPLVNYRARIDFDDQGRPTPYHVTADNGEGVLTWGPAIYRSGTDGAGNPVYSPIITFGLDGSVSLNTDNDAFRSAYGVGIGTLALEPGKAYEWTIFGQEAFGATDLSAAYFYKRFPLPANFPNPNSVESQDAFSFGSTDLKDNGSPNGTFVLAIGPDAN
jgi:hypothetical protein